MGLPRPEELISNVNLKKMPSKWWMDTLPVEFKPGFYCYGAKGKNLEYVNFPNARDFHVTDEDWKLPEDWKKIVIEGIKQRLERFRTFHVFMDICVRCGACADKCHFFIGTGDPKNMPVLRAELLRSVYRKYFTSGGKLFGRNGGARDLDIDVLKELWYYFYQCTECRRCSLFCPYGIDTAEITIIARELLNLLGLNTDWISGPVANCYRTGNHLGIEPHTMKSTLEFMCNDIEEITGIKIEPPINKKGAEILFITPSGDLFADPGIYNAMGYMMLFHELGLDYTWSTFASEGGNFGFFTSMEMAKRLHSKIYEEAKRLKVKWILGGECGHMWRVWHQYHNTWYGPVDFLEEPVSPITGTKFENAKSNKIVHISEFTADLIKHGVLKFDKSRNDNLIVTFHDSCNPSRGMGIFEEPRYIIKNVCNHFYEMPDETIREQTFCCGGGSGLNAGEIMELRMRGGFPRANAVRYVHEKFGVNMLANICAIDRATLPPLMDYWVPGVRVSGVTELVANAMIMKGEKERTMNLRMEPLPGKEEE
ncbi:MULTISPECIES: sulfate reduction electron transfer complex DsrMKJOP subunit DsrK [Thermodesulfovibrio]|uniref:DsrK protein n=2 Tax=Thermodesulfovibrio yellowstonii TaxID=28262 RepID=B5YGT0_THEYD|nr:MULTISPECIES: (Fe-S)-binding protein [Thermodesulfovibrio]ACI21329.1 DsrK protein [Thermodesulfovibrio yellowstonii DSM 11347]MDI6865384.1 (Fe-S)-binding protein [Thermodesulfovibrio yellowstonii]GLI52536.1 Hdr menaquinol oxidoreductase iron-sulfur subunit [Thermodesulfovibrio islandicus]